MAKRTRIWRHFQTFRPRSAQILTNPWNRFRQMGITYVRSFMAVKRQQRGSVICWTDGGCCGDGWQAQIKHQLIFDLHSLENLVNHRNSWCQLKTTHKNVCGRIFDDLYEHYYLHTVPTSNQSRRKRSILGLKLPFDWILLPPYSPLAPKHDWNQNWQCFEVRTQKINFGVKLNMEIL